MTAYYNEIDPKAAAWLRELIRCGHIALGEVDERSITDVQPDDVRGFTQCHFFAGIGGWSYALRLAGWSDSRSVWTGSCPCQPFSAACKGAGKEDATRHLWPAWERLIRECKPATIFGEQVGAAIGYGWLDDVFLSLEQSGYSCGAAVFPSCSVGAPHIRSRLYFVADSNGRNASAEGLQRSREHGQQQEDGGAVLVGDAEQQGLQEQRGNGRIPRGQDGTVTREAVERAGAPVSGFWSGAEWIHCRDGKSRPVKPGSAALVAGLSTGMGRGSGSGSSFDPDNSPEARVMRLRGYGNSIVAPAAAGFVKAYLNVRAE